MIRPTGWQAFGSAASSTGGMNAAAATRQNELAVNAARQQPRQRAIVRRLTPSSTAS